MRLAGRVSAHELISVVRLVQEQGHSAQLQVVHDTGLAAVTFDEGLIVDASFRDQRGLAAVAAMLLDPGEVAFDLRDDPPPPSPTVGRPRPLLPSAPAMRTRRYSHWMRPLIRAVVPAAIIVAVTYLPMPPLRWPGAKPITSPDTTSLGDVAPMYDATPVDLASPVAPAALDTTPALPPLMLTQRLNTARTPPWETTTDGRNPPLDFGGLPRHTWTTTLPYRLKSPDTGAPTVHSAPIPGQDGPVSVRASFRKVGGPDGSAYGIVVRQQQAADAADQTADGSYYVLQVNDRGEVAIWRRVGTAWDEIMPWTLSSAVQPGAQPNLLRADSIGTRLSFFVNGTEVAQNNEAVGTGHVGLFVSGGTEAVLQNFSVSAGGAP